jgi:4-diphosphocytidyl-2-C-methyl-D-erythritol kinase
MELSKPLWFVLVCPPFGLSTADVYATLAKSEEWPATTTEPEAFAMDTEDRGEQMRQAVRAGDVEEIGRRLHNRLQPVAERLCPVLADYRSRLAELQPVGQALSGSGTSLFALCRDYDHACEIARGWCTGPREAMNPRVEIVRSCS